VWYHEFRASERLRVWKTPNTRPELRAEDGLLPPLDETCFAEVLQVRQIT